MRWDVAQAIVYGPRIITQTGIGTICCWRFVVMLFIGSCSLILPLSMFPRRKTHPRNRSKIDQKHEILRFSGSTTQH